MMNEVKEEIRCGQKRSRYDAQMDEKQDHPKKNPSTRFQSDSSIIAFLEWEENNDNICDIDEECIYNLMRELMEEIGINMGADLPLPPPSEMGKISSSNSASASTLNCYSIPKQLNSIGSDVGKTIVGEKEYGEYIEREKVNGNCNKEEDLSEVIDKGGILINDNCICKLNRAFSGDEFLQIDDDVSSDMNFNGGLSDRNSILSASSEQLEGNSDNECRR